jgi:hypothetical protein
VDLAQVQLIKEAESVKTLATCSMAGRRYVFFSIPPANRREAGMVDYGICTIRVATVKVAVAKD